MVITIKPAFLYQYKLIPILKYALVGPQTIASGFFKK